MEFLKLWDEAQDGRDANTGDEQSFGLLVIHGDTVGTYSKPGWDEQNIGLAKQLQLVTHWSWQQSELERDEKQTLEEAPTVFVVSRPAKWLLFKITKGSNNNNNSSNIHYSNSNSNNNDKEAIHSKIAILPFFSLEF